MTEKKSLELMDFGELIINLIKTEKEIVRLEHLLDQQVLDEHWRNSPYPENKESSILRMRKEYQLCDERFADLQRELNRREKLYLEK